MICRFCGKDPESPVVLLPEPARPTLGISVTDRSDKGSSIFGCMRCAIENEYFCVAHNQVHIGFGSRGGHGCLACVNNEAARLEPMAAELISFLFDAIPSFALEDLGEDVELAGDLLAIVGSDPAQTTPARCLARFIVCAAISRLTTAEEIVALVRRTRDINILLPHPLGLPD